MLAPVRPFYQVEIENGQKLIRELSKPIDLNLILTKRCNQNCIHCCASAGDSSADMSLELIGKIIKMAEEEGIFYVVLTGGEPLMHPQFFKILDMLNNKLGIIVNTNATLMNDKNVSKIRTYTIASYHVSVDAPNKELFLEQRGSDSFESVLSGVKRLVESGANICAKVVVTRINHSSLRQIVEKVASMGIPSIRFSWYKPVGRATQYTDKLFMNKGLAENSIRQAYALKEQFKDVIDIGLDNAQCFPFLINACSSIKYRKLCGDYFCRVNSKGDVFPCPFLEVKIGNVYEKSFSEIWKDNYLLELRRLSSGKALKGGCESCEYNEICLGGCRARPIALGYGLDGKDPMCWIK